jgi:hypothetical protein
MLHCSSSLASLLCLHSRLKEDKLKPVHYDHVFVICINNPAVKSDVRHVITVRREMEMKNTQLAGTRACLMGRGSVREHYH